MNNVTWFISAGDGPFYFAETINKLGWFPVIWRSDEGFGTNHGFRLWYDYTLQLCIKVFSLIGFNWWWIDKILWFGAITLALYASYAFGKYFFKKPYVYLVPLIYVANTYFLLLFSGGQLGVTWAYAYMPLVVLSFMRVLDERDVFSLKKTINRGFSLAFLTALDLRFAYVLLGIVVLYHLVFRITHGIKGFWISILDIGAALLMTLGIHAFWILPTLFMGGAGVGGLDIELTSPGMLKFLSFADYPHAISLLHPNWPENFFGKVYFLQPEFLVLPILAFSVFLVHKKTTDKKVQVAFFGVLALTGAFLAKGVQNPFTGVYQWMFAHIPGFVMFRDPTKFYVCVALSYSVLIPFVLQRINKKPVFIIFVVFWLFTIRAVFLGQVKGNFMPLQIPAEYIQLKNLLVSDPAPSRTLWIPQREKFAYASNTHPLLYADQLFRGASVSAIMNLSDTPGFMKTIADAGVRYVVVPQDVEGRLFLNDYRFDVRERNALIAALKKTSLVESPSFHNVSVFINNDFTFISNTPASLTRQQQLTNEGLVISAVILLFTLCILYF